MTPEFILIVKCHRDDAEDPEVYRAVCDEWRRRIDGQASMSSGNMLLPLPLPVRWVLAGGKA